MTNLPAKDPAILTALAYLSEHLGAGEFAIADHWDFDFFAVGLARRDDLGVLVYISCFSEPAGCYDYESELPPPAGSDLIYLFAGGGSGLSLPELAHVVHAHLVGSASPATV